MMVSLRKTYERRTKEFDRVEKLKNEKNIKI